MAAISVEDVATAIGRPITSDDEYAQVDQWISDVELLIGAKLVLADLDQNLLAYVERETVIARMRHRSETQATTDDVDQGDENYFLRVLGPWWTLLAPQKEIASSMYSVRPTFEPDTIGWTSNGWWTVPW